MARLADRFFSVKMVHLLLILPNLPHLKLFIAPLQVEENLRRVRLLFAEVQAGVQELALPNVDFDNLQHHLDNIAQENAAQVSVCIYFVSCLCAVGVNMGRELFFCSNSIYLCWF